MMKYILLLLAFSTQVFASSSAVNPTTVGNTYGAQVTASASYTPTIAGLGTVASPSFYYWRVADRLFVHGTFTSGSVGGTLASITLPSGLNIDTTKITNTANTVASPRVGFAESPGSNAFLPILASVTSSTSLVYIGNQTNGTTQTTPQTGSTCCGSSVIFTVDFNVPISGWPAVGGSGSGAALLPRSEVHLDTGAGVGSTNTLARRYANTRKNIGPCISYVDSATLGATFTIQSGCTGVYTIDASSIGSSSVYSAIVVNGTALGGASSINSQTYAAGGRNVGYSVGGDANVPAKASWTGILTAGDFVNIAGNGESCTVDFRCRVSIVQVSY